MPKRPPGQHSQDGEDAYLKRQKISHFTTATEDIQSAKQLHQLLTFDQDATRARHGIQSFKVFLDAFSEEDGKKSRFPILRDYLQLVKPRDEEDKAAVCLQDIMQTWNLAAQSNNDSLISAVPAVLDLLFKTLSTIVEFSEYGRRLGRTLLQKQQLELLTRNLSSPKSKDFIISPCLRLLRQLVTFDGGVLAKEVFRARDYTFRALGRNLGVRFLGDGVEDSRKPSVRTHAVRFFLACIKLLPEDAKKELIGQRDLISGVTRDLSKDSPLLVAEFLETMRNFVLKDNKLTRDAKLRFMNATNLGRIATLYGYDREDDALLEGKKSVTTLAHEFLILACTSPDSGILYRPAGFYPRNVDPVQGNDAEDQQFIDLGLESLEFDASFAEKVPVRNTILSEFIQSLRPWSDLKQSELLLEIFKAAPELVADYFFSKKPLTFEPKLTATWIGYSAFLFSTVGLPVPPYLGHQNGYGQLPPPSIIVIESILPQPLTQKVLTRCLNQKSALITFFAVRILTVAFQKLQDMVGQYRDASKTGSSIWLQAAQQLTEEFCRRCPAMKDVITAFTNMPQTDLLQRQAASRLLLMYYETIPQIALESKIDVSVPLTESLRLLEMDAESEDHTIRVMIVENLFQIAHYSPGMRWFNKAESLQASPFTAMLRLLAEVSSDIPLVKMRSILDSIVYESGIMQLQTPKTALDALLAALQMSAGKANLQVIYEFLTDCILRCSTTPVKYIDILEIHLTAVHDADTESDVQRHPLSLLLLAIAEQWPFILKSSEANNAFDVAIFIVNYVAASLHIEEDKKIMKAIVKDLIAVSPEGSVARKVIEGYKKHLAFFNIPEASAPSPDIKSVDKNQSREFDNKDVEIPMIDIPETDLEDHSALTKWTAKDIEEVIEQGHASALIALLSSPHLSARVEAISNMSKLSLKLKQSTHPSKDQIWLLLSELIETARPKIATIPLPTSISTFASHAFPVLTDPLHILYPKLNTFLSRGPSWQTDKLPLMHSILHEPPSVDDAHYAEISFLLTYLVASLRTPSDMAIFHKRRVFEKLLSLYNNVYLGKGLKGGILRVLWRATAVASGSTTLITRFSILSWLGAQMAVEDEVGREKLGALMKRVLETCDAERLKVWSGRSADDFLAELRDR